MKPYLALEASAGSGKTFALSVRYLALLFMGANPQKIVALTFTNKAASEMKTRIFETLKHLETKDELDAIAACVVVGVSTSGGICTVPGVLAGVLIFGVINYGLTFIGISPYWQLIIKGLIIVAAVAFDIRKYLAKK